MNRLAEIALATLSVAVWVAAIPMIFIAFALVLILLAWVTVNGLEHVVVPVIDALKWPSR